MMGSIKISIIKHLKTQYKLNLFSVNKLSWVVILSSAPLLVSSFSVASEASPQKIAQTSNSTNINRPNLKVGSKGDAVVELQAALKILGFYSGTVDGNYNELTTVAVSRFQQAAGLNPDGLVGASTWQKLFPSGSTVASSPTATGTSAPITNSSAPKPRTVAASAEPKPSTPANTQKKAEPEATPTRRRQESRDNETATRRETTTRSDAPKTSSSGNRGSRRSETTAATQRPRNTQPRVQSTATEEQKPNIQYTAEGYPILRLGMRGPEVVKLQERLSNMGFLKAGVDGDFGAETEVAVKAMQERFGLEADGIVGGASWDILNRRPRRQAQ
jgi:peptidoglycan hydrolase-like protein with peptidoglycan-binding domain